MRHRVRGRHLGRTPSHRKAMFRNMAVSLIRSVREDPDMEGAPKVRGRIVTTVAKAKELRPFLEKLVTMARKSLPIQREADELKTDADKNTEEWRKWRSSEDWNKWNQAQAPALAFRRRAFSILRDDEAVDILFDEIAERFEDRPGGYTRIVRLAQPRLGDAGAQALFEFVGERDRVKTKAAAAPVVVTDDEETTEETSAEQSDETAESAEAVETEAPAEDSTTEEAAADADASAETEATDEEKKDE